MPPDIILYALIAAGLIFWLKNIIGTRDEGDGEAPSRRADPQNDDEELLPPMLRRVEKKQTNVVSLKGGMGAGFQLPYNVRLDSKSVEISLERLSREIPSFDFHHFIHGVEHAFPMIIEAFASGDKETLQNLLAPSVYAAFEKVIDERMERGEQVETSVKAVEKIDVIQAEEKGDMILLTVRFTARETCVIRDSQGAVLSGDPDRTTLMVDVWVFGKDAQSDAPEWYLVETRDEEPEDHKTPIPDAGKDD